MTNKTTNTPKFANLTDIFTKGDAQNSHVGNRLVNTIKQTQRTLVPPFPKQIQVETTNICNHACSFCAYTLMERAKGQMKPELFKRLVQEAYENGAREIGLFAGAEPLTCKWLDEYVSYCRDIGYEYMYISSNGSFPKQERFKQILDAGLNSIKFSVNGGNREVYKAVHGNDHFDRVIDNIRFVCEYRKSLSHKVYVGVSFVAMAHTQESYSELKALLADTVDEMIYYEASNQSGQMDHLPLPPYRDCHLPFNKLHISKEGYLKACCNDYENLLAIEDLNEVSLLQAWQGDKFQQLRDKHLNNCMDGTLCANCIRASKVKPKPINASLLESRETTVKNEAELVD